MTNEEIPDVEEIKERLKVEIKIEVDETEDPAAEAEVEEIDITGEFKKFGEQMANTLRSAWSSEERQKLEKELKSGVNSFVSEIDKAIDEIKSTKISVKIKEEAAHVQNKVEASEASYKIRKGLAFGLRRISQEMDELATRFSKSKAADPAEENKQEPGE